MTRIYVLGGGHVGATLARNLSDFGDVVFLDPEPDVVGSAERAGLTAREADVTSVQDLARHGVDTADLAVVTSDDAKNLLAVQLLRVRFDVERIVVCVNDPRNVDSFEELDVETVCVTSAVADELGDRFGVDEQSSDITRESRLA